MCITVRIWKALTPPRRNFVVITRSTTISSQQIPSACEDLPPAVAGYASCEGNDVHNHKNPQNIPRRQSCANRPSKRTPCRNVRRRQLSPIAHRTYARPLSSGNSQGADVAKCVLTREYKSRLESRFQAMVSRSSFANSSKFILPSALPSATYSISVKMCLVHIREPMRRTDCCFVFGGLSLACTW